MLIYRRAKHYTRRLCTTQINKYGLSASEPTEVGVFGLFQCGDEDGSDAYFVVELPDGKCCYAGVDDIQFIKDTEEEAE